MEDKLFWDGYIHKGTMTIIPGIGLVEITESGTGYVSYKKVSSPLT